MSERLENKIEDFGGRVGRKPTKEKTGMTDEETRVLKFQKHFNASDVLMNCMIEVTEKHKARIKLRGNKAEKDLDLLVATMYGKAAKTFGAVLKLCRLGFGEDALILIRANVNLMINFFYILSENSVERAGDLIAYSHQEQKKYLQVGHKAEPEWMKQLNWGEINERAKQWDRVKIRERAEKAKQLSHYDVGYRFYSSIEHSDAVALSRYIEKWDEEGVKISSDPSDNDVSIALTHNFWSMANIFLGFCAHFSIKEEGLKRRLNEKWTTLAE